MVSMFGMCAIGIALLEIPTGIIGDIWGAKHSITIAYFAHAISMAMYVMLPGLVGFGIAVIIEALGHASLSGSESVLLRGICEEHARSELSRQVSVARRIGYSQPADKLFYSKLAQLKNWQSIGLMIGCVITILLGSVDATQQTHQYGILFAAHIIMNTVAGGICCFFLPGSYTFGLAEHANVANSMSGFWYSPPLNYVI